MFTRLRRFTFWGPLVTLGALFGAGLAFIAATTTEDNGLILFLALWLLALAAITIARLDAAKGASDVTEGGEVRGQKVTFDNVAGLDEVLDDLKELVSYIRDRERYIALDAQLPRGVLFYGPPGTGKTLMAKALATEAGATFLYASGSSFVEKYVGVGSQRVRALFSQARKKAPAIIFIDEIDSIGRSRRSAESAEWDSTLNQLLAEIDGFTSSDNILLVAATNRRELLDEALLRPGRLDRQIYIGLPDLDARRAILAVHCRRKPLAADADLEALARRTPGLTGAHLSAVVNEAALAAVRHGRQEITGDDFSEALERVLAGLAGRNSVLSGEERQVVAYHEAGHAVVGWALRQGTIERMSILPRSRALAYVLQVPEERTLHNRRWLLDRVATLLGGRAAEQLVFQDFSTGAADDLAKATHIAERMVCEYGMSERRPHQKLRDEVLVMSPLVQAEVDGIIREGWEQAYSLVDRYRDRLDSLAQALLERETLDREEVQELLSPVTGDPAGASVRLPAPG